MKDCLTDVGINSMAHDALFESGDAPTAQRRLARGELHPAARYADLAAMWSGRRVGHRANDVEVREDRPGSLGGAGGWRRGGDEYPPPTLPPARPHPSPSSPAGVRGRRSPPVAAGDESAARPSGQRGIGPSSDRNGQLPCRQPRRPQQRSPACLRRMLAPVRSPADAQIAANAKQQERT